MNDQREKASVVNNVVVTLCDASSRDAKALESLIARMHAGTARRKMIRAYHRRFAVARFEYANIVPAVALAVFARAVTGDLASLADIEVNKTALGTGDAAPSSGDTTLDTEVFRKNVASQSHAGAIGYNTAFYTATEVSGTFKEHGLFMNGAGADTGTLLSRVLLNAPDGIVKTATNSLTIETSTTFVFNA